MSKETGSWDISVCGLNCAKCDLYQASRGNEEAMKRIMGWLKDAKPGSIFCGGCRGPLNIHWSADCKFLECTKKKGLKYCFECDEFACDRLQAFASDGYWHHRKTVENMKRMKEIGIEAWVEEQKKKGQCVFCP
jgi:hypothetical protein